MSEPRSQPQQFPPPAPQWPPGGGGLPAAPVALPSTRRRRWVVFGSIGLALALIAGLTTWLDWPHPRNRTPFEQAVASLAHMQGVHYTDTSITGQKRDITTTQFGEQFGVTSYKQNDPDAQGVLRVNGKIYTKFLQDTGKLGKWTTGDPNNDEMYGGLIKEFPAPQQLASTLSNALAALPNLPAPGDVGLPNLTINGVPALRADTSAGTLYVAKNAPYRVLRLEPQGMFTPSQLESRSALPPLSALPSVLPDTAAASEDSQGMDLSLIDAAQADQMYTTLSADTQQLSDAVDAGIDFSLTTNGTFDCNAGGCSVLETFTGTLSTNAQTRITSGQVTAKLTVTNVAIDGRPAGGCVSAPTTIPVTGNTASGQLSCDDPEAGPVFAAVDQQYQQQAQQQANASGGSVTLTYWATGDAEVDAEAVGQAEVDQLLNQEQAERTFADCTSPNSFAPGTRVLLADGSTRPIEEITPGTEVLATDPQTGRTAAEPVLARVIGSGAKQLDQLSIADGRRTASVTATAGHPFWDPTQHDWVTAADLRPDEALAGLPGSGSVHVTANRTYQAITTVYNLTVARIHTYYVFAGITPVLVHNAGCDGVGNALNNWRSQRYQFGNQRFLLDKSDMTHILQRHAPAYWNGSTKGVQTFFDPKMSIQDIQDAISSVLSQNRDDLISRGTASIYQIGGSYKGVDYVLGINNGHVGQFYPLPQK